MEDPKKSKKKGEKSLTEGVKTDSGLTVRCSAHPADTINEGGVVILEAQPSNHNVTYLWNVYGKGRLDKANADKVHWDTTGMIEGTHKATVTIKDIKDKTKTASDDVYIIVRQRSVSHQEVKDIYKDAKQLAKELFGGVRQSVDALNINLDMKMDSLKSELGNEVTATGKQRQAIRVRRGTSEGSSDNVDVSLQSNIAPKTLDQALWAAIKNRTDAISFNRYQDVMDRVLDKISIKKSVGAVEHIQTKSGHTPFAFGSTWNKYDLGLTNLYNPLHGVDAYNLLKIITEIFLLLECGVVINDEITDPSTGDVSGISEVRLPNKSYNDLKEEINDALTAYLGTQGLPYLDLIFSSLFADANLEDPQSQYLVDLPYRYGILRSRFSCPCMIELIWSYWHEEGMLVQSINAISLRFQNRRLAPNRDPLAHLEIDPLRPLNNLLWGYIQDEQNRLSVVRRAYEYDHHYGLTLYGNAVPKLQTADSRSKFLEAFHNLLHLAWVFFKEQADTTVVPDGFPLLNALKEVHLLLAEGAHNQFGDLPWTARVEMLIQQWLLSRPEMREFLGGRIMVPYREDWMRQVDVMKTLQGWTDVTVRHFHDLAVFGEQLLLSIRYGNWSEVFDENQAKNWAVYWRPEIQSYIHAYRVVTGNVVDLSSEVVDSMQAAQRSIQPSVHLRQQLIKQNRQKQQSLPPSVQPTVQLREKLARQNRQKQ